VSRPEIAAGIEAADDAYRHVHASAASLTDADAQGPSRLPGWSRGHVLTHLARNADGIRNMVEGALADQAREQYPGGAAGRAREIDAGADRDAATLVADLVAAHDALMDAWRRMPADAWSRPGIWLVAGPQPVETTLVRRRRELLVHWIDLDLGATPADLPDDYIEAERGWLREQRTTETWPDASW
jgi:maleylpyruvate isomerase